MRHRKATTMFTMMFLGTILAVCLASELQAKTAIISRKGDSLHVTYYSPTYSLRRVPDYPTLHYSRVDARAVGRFYHYWDSPSRVNRWPRW